MDILNKIKVVFPFQKKNKGNKKVNKTHCLIQYKMLAQKNSLEIFFGESRHKKEKSISKGRKH